MKEKKKTKKRKVRSREELIKSGRQPARAVQKDPGHLYSGTALDPRDRVRKRVMRKAQRFAEKKRMRRSTSSSRSGSSSSSSTTEEATATDGVFSEETKARALAERYPGALALETLASMRRSLLVTSGEEGEGQGLQPVALLYYRNVLHRKAMGAQARELLNIATAIDSLLKSRPAQTLDILCQRLKAQEAVLGGTSWTVAQKIELASGEAPALIARGELQTAQRESYLDSRARYQSQAAGPAKGKSEKGKGKGKGDRDYNNKEERRDERRAEKGKGDKK